MRRWALMLLLLTTAAVAAPREAPSQPEALVDPMRPLAVPGAGATADSAPQDEQNYALSAIKLDGRRSHAIINEQLVYEGGRIGQAVVRKIRSQQVDISTSKGPLVLRLNSYEIKHDTEVRKHLR